jgi:hypothetical protein
LDFLSLPTRATGGEVIKTLDDNKEDVMNKYKQEEVLPKIKPDQTDGEIILQQASKEKQEGPAK